MKKQLMLLTFFMSLMCTAETLRLSEPVYVDESSETFGKRIDTAIPQTTLAQLMSDPSQHQDEPFRVNAQVAKVCQKKGCFFIAQAEEHVVRIAFKDYGFFVPTDIAGKTVEISGILVAKHRSKEAAEHFNQDLASSDTVLNSGAVYEIVADGIKVPI